MFSFYIKFSTLSRSIFNILSFFLRCRILNPPLLVNINPKSLHSSHMSNECSQPGVDAIHGNNHRIHDPLPRLCPRTLTKFKPWKRKKYARWQQRSKPTIPNGGFNSHTGASSTRFRAALESFWEVQLLLECQSDRIGRERWLSAQSFASGSETLKPVRIRALKGLRNWGGDGSAGVEMEGISNWETSRWIED